METVDNVRGKPPLAIWSRVEEQVAEAVVLRHEPLMHDLCSWFQGPGVVSLLPEPAVGEGVTALRGDGAVVGECLPGV